MAGLWKALSMNQKDRLVFVLKSLAEEYGKLDASEQEFFLLALSAEFEKVGVSLDVKENGY